MDDQYLWNNIQKGDKDALKRLHTKYYHQMYLYAAKQLSDENGLAEELVADCFIKIWENRKQINIRTSVKQYLFVILQNGIIDHFRKKRILTQPLSDEIQAPGDEKFFDDQKQYARLHIALRRLPDQCRRVLELAIYESLTYNEIGTLHI